MALEESDKEHATEEAGDGDADDVEQLNGSDQGQHFHDEDEDDATKQVASTAAGVWGTSFVFSNTHLNSFNNNLKHVSLY